MKRPARCIRIKAPAKVNLFLYILGKRPDGYHDLYSVLQMVSLYDELTFEPERTGISLVNLSSNPPADGNNLVVKAAQRLAQEAKVALGARITLKKNIPIGAGLGGGSSDAAATLIALNRLWKLGYSRSELARMGQDLGSDIPFFLYGPTALVAGRGERVIPAIMEGARWFVLINPGFEVSTRWVYEQFSLHQAVLQGRADSKNSWLTKIRENIRIQDSGKFRLQYSDLSLYNDLEDVTEAKYPVVREMKAGLKGEGAEGVLMSGSGPTVFGIFEKRIQASQAARGLRQGHPDWKIWTLKSLKRSPY